MTQYPNITELELQYNNYLIEQDEYLKLVIIPELEREYFKFSQ